MVLVRRDKPPKHDPKPRQSGKKVETLQKAVGTESRRDFAIMLAGGNPLYQKGFKLILSGHLRSKGRASFFLHGCSPVESVEANLSELSERQKQFVIIFLLDEGGEPAATIRNIDALKKANPSCNIIVSSNSKNPDYINRCIEKGIQAYLPSDISEDLLVDCISLVAHGQMVIPSPSYCGKSETASQQQRASSNAGGNPPKSAIDDREAKILGCLASGMPNKEISRLTGLSDPATKMAVRKLLSKIGAKNRVQAAVWAEKNGYFLDI